MDKVRIGIVGVGNMGSAHAKSLQKGNVERAELTAICDLDATKMEPFEGVAKFEDSGKMIRSGEIDAVLVATPHYDHTTIGIDSLQQGVHTLIEKPISVHKADCQRLIAAHTDPKVVFCAMFNQRTDPRYRKVKSMIESGELGEIRRVNWIITNWFRSQAYYSSGGWRATWAGEGGGVLMNQCPHNLDLLQWLCGMPNRVSAVAGFGKYHDIEVEDDVTAYLDYPNGATGVFITTTGESPGTNRLEISGDNGKVIIEGGVTFVKNEEPMHTFRENSPNAFGGPKTEKVEIPTDGGGEQHDGILRNFTAAILDGAELIAPAPEGIHSVELANAMIWSAKLGQPVDLPLDAAGYEAKLKELIASSTFEKKVDENVKTDLSESWK